MDYAPGEVGCPRRGEGHVAFHASVDGCLQAEPLQVTEILSEGCPGISAAVSADIICHDCADSVVGVEGDGIGDPAPELGVSR